MGKKSIDTATLLAFARALKAQGKIKKIEMESKTFVDMLKNEYSSFAKGFKKEGKEWGKALGDELGAWGDAFKNVF